MSTSSAPTIDDIQTQINCLYRLLECIYEVSTNIQYRLPDGEPDLAAERTNALIILARDECQRIDISLEDCLSNGRAS